MEYEACVICTSPRSGSTLLCRMLSATGVAGEPESYFHRPSVSDWLRDLEVTPPEGASEEARLRLAFRAAVEQGTRGGLFGLRLQRHSFPYFIERLAELHPGPAGDAERFRAAFGRTLFVHLTRGDKVGQAVSYVKASQSGLWHRAPDGTELERLSPPREPVYDGEAIRAEHDKMLAFDRGWEAWFETAGIAPHRMTYEALSADSVGELRRVLARLGRNPRAAEDVRPGVAKLADAVSRDWADRFRAELEDRPAPAG